MVNLQSLLNGKCKVHLSNHHPMTKSVKSCLRKKLKSYLQPKNHLKMRMDVFNIPHQGEKPHSTHEDPS